MWIDEAMCAVSEAQLFPDRHTHIFLMNTSDLRRRLCAVQKAFDAVIPSASSSSSVSFLHAFAVKANPLQAVLETVRDVGFAAETASFGEFRLAESVMHDPRRIIFDSPTKTMEELHHAIQLPCYINVDNFDELDRIVALAEGRAGLGPAVSVRATIGIRVNPQSVTHTHIAALSTGAKVSKFGVSLRDSGNRQRIVDAFRAYHTRINLRMLHVHSGSQGLALDTLVDGVQAVVESLANDEALAPFVDVIDIGGGLPVNFASEEDGITFRDYAEALRARVPSLFQPTPHHKRERVILTEFGRAVAAKAGIMISRVEYVKMSGGRQIIQQHIGADLAVRTVWQPESWPLRVFLYDRKGCRKRHQGISHTEEGEIEVRTDVAGPCCNSGCALTRAAVLPTHVKPLEDMIVVADVGAYYHSSYSLYNLRPMPACYVYREEEEEDKKGEAERKGTGSGTRLQMVKRAQTEEDVMKLFFTDS